MKRNDTQDNGSETIRGGFNTQVIDENPYLQRTVPDESESSRGVDEVIDGSVGDEFGAPIEPEDKRRKVKQRRRRIALAALATVFLLAIIAATALYRRTSTRVDYGRTTKQTAVLPPVPNTTTTTGRDPRTQKAIDEAQQLTAGQKNSDPKEAHLTEDASKSKTILDTPFTIPPASNNPTNLNPGQTGTGTNETNSDVRSTAAPSASSQPVVRSQRSSEVSLYMNESSTVQVSNAPKDTKEPTEKKPTVATEKAETITLPAFASMLPVRTIGALYTLRTGALVRFELTRETKGDGWSMKRGTILVGTSKGGDFDRAYASLIGFIDPQTGKLVKLGGDLLGGDGAVGLRGKRRQIDGGWTRALKSIASSTLDVTGTLLSGRGRDTVIISDGVRTKTINPVTDELSGVLGTELDRKQGRSFVEVMAGTPGYVLVTDLPNTIKGIEPTPELDSDKLVTLSDVDAMRPTTGLSEHELADLLANGSPEQIREAMPRMSPEMRKVATAVLRP